MENKTEVIGQVAVLGLFGVVLVASKIDLYREKRSLKKLRERTVKYCEEEIIELSNELVKNDGKESTFEHLKDVVEFRNGLIKDLEED